MRVAFDSRPGADSRGIGRYARCLLASLRDEAAARGGEVTETHRPRRHDVFHSPWIDGAPLRPRIPSVVTLHDLIPLKRPGEYLRTGVRFRMRYLAVERAARLIVPTRAVAADAIELLSVDPDRVHVIAEAAAPAFTPRPPDQVAAVRERYALPEDYLVWVGGLRHPDPRKRVAAMAGTPRELPLVLVGDPGQWARELAGVTLTGAVSDDELAAIYSGAHALVFPSDDEGFGLPPVEALACGTPVAATASAAVEEVLGGRVTLVDAGDLAGLLAAAERATRPAPAPPAWTWDDAARATWDVYELAVTPPAG
ncbi:MAG TPA: glycosyltransferase family 1 protein [Solirubrobacteraceae bacterium]|jgi:alpha-1,3-rhamnosyl/mannosyltransferase